MRTARELVHEIEAKAKVRTALRPPIQEPKSDAPRGRKAQVIQLPLWPEELHAMPDHLARTPLFAPIRRGRRPHHERAALACRSDVAVLYTGPQLDQADCDVWMQALHEARGLPLGEPIYINRADFLRQIGRCERGQAAYQWLADSFSRLAFSNLEIETKRYKVGFHLIDSYALNKETGEYWLSINPRALILFSNHEFGLIDWTKRLRISRGNDLAKWLQNYAASHAADKTHTIDVRLLQQWSGAEGRLRDFRDRALPKALAELKRLEIIKDARIREDGKVTWRRPAPKASK